MAIDIYSKSSVDTLLAPKLSVSSLSNGATTTLNATAPTLGQVLSFDGTDLVWATGGGGGGWTPGSSDLDLGGYAIVNGGYAQFSNTVKVSGSFGAVTLGGNDYGVDSILTLTNYSQTLVVGATGITFPDSTVQTTAATAGASRADVITISHVQNVTGIYMGGVQFTFAPINSTVAYFANLYVTDGTTTEYITGGWSETLPWTFTSSSALSTSTYLYVGAWGQTSTIPVTFP